jgi:hypothetical protein
MDLKSDEILSFLASNFFHTKTHLQLISSEMLRLEVDTQLDFKLFTNCGNSSTSM